MSDFRNLITLIQEMRDKVDQIEAELNTLQQASAGTPRSLRPAQKDRAAEILLPDPNNLPGVFPPRTLDDLDSIVGGTLTTDFPDCCAVGDDKGYYCSGTLIAPGLVITAGHCTGVKRVFLKGHDTDEPQFGETIAVTRTIVHDEVDLRILLLEKDSSVTPRHVARGDEIKNPTEALVVGFGTIDFRGRIGYGLKRKVKVPIASLGCNTDRVAIQFGCKRDKELVAGHKGLLKDTCRGDSGGPLYIKSTEGDYYLLGATSRGLGGTGKECGDGGIYIRVDWLLDWIHCETGVRV